MGRPSKKAKVNTDNVVVDTGLNNPLGADATYGVVIGDTAQAAPTIKAKVKVGSNAAADGFIIRQKGKRKFLVSDASSNIGVCILVNKASGELAADEMYVEATPEEGDAFKLATLSSKFGTTFPNEDGEVSKVILSFNDIAEAATDTSLEVVKVTSA
jgi:hypothetical protein